MRTPIIIIAVLASAAVAVGSAPAAVPHKCKPGFTLTHGRCVKKPPPLYGSQARAAAAMVDRMRDKQVVADKLGWTGTPTVTCYRLTARRFRCSFTVQYMGVSMAGTPLSEQSISGTGYVDFLQYGTDVVLNSDWSCSSQDVLINWCGHFTP